MTKTDLQKPLSTARPAVPSDHSANAEAALDGLLAKMEDGGPEGSDAGLTASPLERLRDLMLRELSPVAMELSEKYSPKGISVTLDASNFLKGGREIRLEFALGPYRTVLQGTVTSEAIAFEEVRYSPHIDGELMSGPSLRIRTMTADSFREFLCTRVMLLLKMATKGT